MSEETLRKPIAEMNNIATEPEETLVFDKENGRLAQTSPRYGLLGFDWRWQLAGLGSAIISGFVMAVRSFSEWDVMLIFLGLALTASAIYSGVRTNWLREVRTASLPLKIATGTAIVCGLIPIGVALLCLAVLVSGIVLIVGVIGAALSGGSR